MTAPAAAPLLEALAWALQALALPLCLPAAFPGRIPGVPGLLARLGSTPEKTALAGLRAAFLALATALAASALGPWPPRALPADLAGLAALGLVLHRHHDRAARGPRVFRAALALGAAALALRLLVPGP